MNEEDVYYVPFESSFAFSNFLFVKEYCADDLMNVMEYRRDAFEQYPMHMRITDDEFFSMVEGIKASKKKTVVKYGDIVIAKHGKFSRLHGIVLRESNKNKIEVGFKFCFGKIIEKYDAEELDVTGNIFDYLKVID